ncbi:transcription factor nuclear export protein subunit 2, putative [Babesia ovis]|uniref:Transcription factor nuclear export protein subunit 2, putative n=1 Tax=Babesia ovis TaxID=5869 RepID=A0A9W5T7Y8_BABOV|nr:transcription factor nuclear export protein subunit 2, putative [Babesia ovis]
MVASEQSSNDTARENKRVVEEGDVKGRAVRSRSVASKKAKTTPVAKKAGGESSTKNAMSKGVNILPPSPTQRKPEPVDPKVDHILSSESEDGLSTRLFELIRKVGEGEIAPASAAVGLRNKFADNLSSSPLSFLLLDCVGYFLETQSYRNNLEAFMGNLERCGMLTSREIVAAIDANKLDSCGYSTGLTTIAIRERTRNQFVLKSYGLWRECTVGFDLLQRLLYHHEWNPNVHSDVERLEVSVKQVAGDFSLCPTRVLYELVAWCSWNDGEYALALLRQYPNERVDEVVRLMLSQKRTIKQEYQTMKKQPWRLPSIVGPYFSKLCARLLVEGILVMSTLYGYLEPADAELTGLYEHFMQVSKKTTSKISRSAIPIPHLLPIANCSPGDNALKKMVSAIHSGSLRKSALLDTTTIAAARDMTNARHAKLVEEYRKKHGLPPPQAEDPSKNKDISNDNQKSSANSATTAGDEPESQQLPVDLVKYHFLDSDTYSYVRDHIFALECDKLMILACLIDLCQDLNSAEWQLTKQLLGHIQWTVRFPIALHGQVSIAICGLLKRIIAQNKQDQSGISDVEYLLRLIGPSVCVDLVCMSAVMKYLQACLTTHCDQVCNIVWMYLLPAMALVVEGNCQVSERLWAILSKLPASKRYGIYERYVSQILDPKSQMDDPWTPMVRACHNAALVKTRSLFKRVTSNMLKAAKSASVRGNVSIVCGLAAVDPFAVAHTIISQCEMFENLVAPLSEIGKYFGSLACDVFFFKLCCNQNQVSFSTTSEVDDLGRSKKLLVNAQLAARFFRRHVDVDLSPLLVGTLTVLLRTMAITNLDLLPCNSYNHSIKVDCNEPSKSDNNSINMDTIQSIVLDDLSSKPRFSYPDELSQGWLVLEYACKLLEMAGGMPQLAEAHALTIDQLKAQAGGVLLRSEIMMQDAEDEACGMSSREALAKVMLRPLFCYSFLFLCGKMRQEVMYDSDFRAGITSLCATVDQLQKTALQLVEFKESVDTILSRDSSDTPIAGQYALPSFDELRRFWEDANALYLCHSNNTIPKIPDDALSNEVFKPEFLKFLWSIRLGDIWVPTEQYEKTLQRLDNWIKECGVNTSHSGSGSRRLKKLRARYQAVEQEFTKQKERVEDTKQRFAQVVSSGWLSENVQIGPGITIAFLQHCIAPRVFINEAEAAFCSHLIDLMLSNHVECFNFFDFSNSWTKMLMSMVRCCTEREAPLLAIFVNHAFSVIRNWSLDGEAFEAMTKEHPCFCTTFKYVPDKALTHQQLMCGIRKWEGRIMRALSYALALNISDPDSGEEEIEVDSVPPTWVDQKGAIVFLARCHENFPITIAAGKRVLSGLRGVVDNAQEKGWKDVVVAASTLVKTFEKYDRENRWM